MMNYSSKTCHRHVLYSEHDAANGGFHTQLHSLGYARKSSFIAVHQQQTHNLMIYTIINKISPGFVSLSTLGTSFAVEVNHLSGFNCK